MDASTTTNASSSQEKVKFQLNYKKQNTDIEFSLDSTLGELRAHVFSISGVAPGLQKLMYKGIFYHNFF